MNIAQGIRKVIEELRRESPRAIPISPGLLELLNEYKEKCKLKWKTKFLTFHLLLALLDIPNSRTQYFLDCLTPPRADVVRGMCEQYVDLLATRESTFSDFQWEGREELRDALQLVLEDGRDEVTEEH